jgi:hypothetical protein
MPEPNHRKKPYEARVEYRAVQTEAETLLAAGHSIHAVYEQLTAAGRLTLCYSAFCDYVRGKGERRHKNRGQTPQAKPRPSQAAGSKTDSEKPSPFIHDRNVDLSKLA